MGDQLKFGALNNLFGFHLRQAYTPFGQAYREAAANFELKALTIYSTRAN